MPENKVGLLLRFLDDKNSQIVSKLGQNNMDFLDKLIELAQISGHADVRCVFQGEWSVRHDALRGVALVHMISSGVCHLKMDNGENHCLQVGDVVFLPRAHGHWLHHGQTLVPRVMGSEKQGVFTLKTQGEGTPTTEIFCARFEYDVQAQLMQDLPDVMQLKLNPDGLGAVMRLLQHEADCPSAASHSAVNALSALLLVMLLRTHLAENQGINTGILAAWQDRRLGKVVQQIVQQPENDWSVERLAAQAQLSRAQFMRLFKQQIGQSPHAFVQHIRLQKAALLLKSTQQTVLAIALNCGFASETHLSKAFKKHYATTPARYRKQQATHDANNAPEFVI